jgi:hypothetical protein
MTPSGRNGNKRQWPNSFQSGEIARPRMRRLTGEERDMRAYSAPELGTLNENAWKTLRKELLWIASRKVGVVEPAAVDGVWQSDAAIPDIVLRDLKNGVSLLENVPEEKKDWHPGTGKQVLDLVHPSLYPLIYGQSRKLPGVQEAIPSLKFVGGGDILECPFKKEPAGPRGDYWNRHVLNEDYALSEKYQWLPSEVDVSEDGEVRFQSYINNLHPVEHKGLYYAIERVFQHFVPLFEKVLDDLTDKYGCAPRFRVPHFDHTIKYPIDGDFYESDDEAREALWAKIPPLIADEDWKPPEYWPHRDNDLSGSRVQVIVKLANIILTPEKPKYAGGAWHVEGMQNERIVCSGIYYYESENITESLLSFRQSVDSPTDNESDRSDGQEQGYISHYFGISNGNYLSEQLGSVETKAGRCIAFPNVFQHQVQPFELADKTKPGVRKILVFFLVDPFAPILSTANIPPQQREWYADALRRGVPEFRRLPMDVMNTILESVNGCPMSLAEAKEHRAKLMTERKFVVDETSKCLFERKFSLCEH